MSFLDALLILLAGVGAGTINSIVGSGTLITFPTLLFLGYPPLMANVSNNIGLVAGGASASWGYRTELTGHGGTLRKLVPLSLLGAVVGATLLLTLPATAFKTIVPVLIVLALVLVIFGPRLQRAAATRHTDQAAGMPPWRTRALAGGVFVGGVYGGDFCARRGDVSLRRRSPRCRAA